MSPEERVAFAHVRDHVLRTSEPWRPTLQRSLDVIERGLNRDHENGGLT